MTSKTDRIRSSYSACLDAIQSNRWLWGMMP
jgi:hypothetical protein